jgi:hypothetical protein
MQSNVTLMIGLLCGAGLGLIFIGIGAFLLYKGQQSRKKAGDSQGWPSTQGQIVDARIDRSMHTDSDGDTGYSYTPRVEYTYEFGGVHYHGKNISFGLASGYNRQHQAQEIIDRYQVGSEVPVYYDPANPEDSVLERKAGSFTTTLVIGIVFIIVGLCTSCGVLGASLSGLLGNL